MFLTGPYTPHLHFVSKLPWVSQCTDLEVMEMALSTKQRFLSCILFFLKLMNDESWFYLGNTLKSCNDSK